MAFTVKGEGYERPANRKDAHPSETIMQQICRWTVHLHRHGSSARHPRDRAKHSDKTFFLFVLPDFFSLFILFYFILFYFILFYNYISLIKLNFEAYISHWRPRARRTRGCARCGAVQAPKKKRKIKKTNKSEKKAREPKEALCVHCGPWPSLPSREGSQTLSTNDKRLTFGQVCTRVQIFASSNR